MLKPDEIGWIALYLTVLALVIAVEFFLVHKPFEDDEDLRKTVGISTVMLLSTPLFWLITSHIIWILVAQMLGFAVAFLISKGLDKHDHRREDEKRNDKLSRKKDDILNGDYE